MTPIQQAVEIAGGQASLARMLGVSGSFVSQLVAGHRPVPAKKCAAIEKATGITREELRPDIFGEE